VLVRWNPTSVEVEVANPAGPGDHRGVPGAGYGLQAIGERVRAYGGEVVAAGPTPEGFRVHVAIPLGGTR
jgi:signal transduction histidine kinase